VTFSDEESEAMTQSFEEFLAEWRNHALPTVKGRELEAVLEGRSRDLTELALLNGHRAQLSQAIRPYRSTKEFVRALYDASRHHDEKRRGEKGPGAGDDG
jgi:hypothetical protein